MDRSFASPGWAAWSLILMMMLVAAAPANGQEEDCTATASSRCGDLTIKKPFGIVPELATEKTCALFGFQVICYHNIPYLGYYRLNKNTDDYYQLQILDIFYGNSSLIVADMQKHEDLANLTGEGCHHRFPTANTSSKIAIPFSISPTNQQLIFYNCTEPPAPATVAAEGLVERRCGNKSSNTFVARVGGSYYEQGYFLEGCPAIVVPMLVRSGNASARNYEELIRARRLPPDMAAATASRTKKVH